MLVDLVPPDVAGVGRRLVGHGRLDSLALRRHAKVPHVDSLADRGGGQEVFELRTPVDVNQKVASVVKSGHWSLQCLHVEHSNLQSKPERAVNSLGQSWKLEYVEIAFDVLFMENLLPRQ